MKSFFEVLLVFLKLGCTSFGGPVAHLGFFRNEIVEKRKWITEAQYADLIALCQFLPGPASSQVGYTLGLFRGGWWGGAAAWIGFTLPSAAIMIACAYGFSRFSGTGELGWLAGLKVAAVAVVAHALWGMATKLCPDPARKLMAILAGAVLVVAPTPAMQVGAILVGGLAGVGLLSQKTEMDAVHAFPWVPGTRVALGCLVAFFAFLVGLPVLASQVDVMGLQLFDSFFRTGSLVFGGGHVVLPLLESEVVQPGWVGPDSFLAGYGAAQAVPGPLFTFSAYLGAALEPGFWDSIPWLGGVLCLIAIFLPTWLLVPAVLPFWEKLRVLPKAQGALAGANAVVVGLLLAALYDPVWTKGITGPDRFALGLISYFLLAILKVPAWGVVLFAALAGGLVF